MDLYKKILDAEEQMFANNTEQSLVDKLMQDITGSSSSVMNLSQIEKRQHELDRKLYELANKHRKAYEQAVQDGSVYKMPDAYSDDEDATKKDKRFELLNQRYKEEKVDLTEQEQWERDQQRKTGLTSMKRKTEKKQYDLLIDNKVDFIQSSILDGII